MPREFHRCFLNRIRCPINWRIAISLLTETDLFAASRRCGLLSSYLDQHSLPPSPVEFAVQNLFPRPEIEFAFGDCDDDFAAHDLTFEMGIGVVFAGAIVLI